MSFAFFLIHSFMPEWGPLGELGDADQIALAVLEPSGFHASTIHDPVLHGGPGWGGIHLEGHASRLQPSDGCLDVVDDEAELIMRPRGRSRAGENDEGGTANLIVEVGGVLSIGRKAEFVSV